MRAGALVMGPTRELDAATGYLRGAVAIGRSARRGEYVVVHFGSGRFLRTDRLGATAIQALIDGRSEAEATDIVEQIEPGTGERAQQLIDRLGTKGAITRDPDFRVRRRWLRQVAAVAMGLAMRALVPFARLTPTPVLAWMLGSMPSTRAGRDLWRASRLTVLNGHGPGGSTAARRPNPQRNFLFMYLSTLLPSKRLDRLANYLFDRESTDKLARRLRENGPEVGVFLHSPLCVAVPNVLRSQGLEVTRVAVPCAHGINVSKRSGPLGDFFGDSPDQAVELRDPHGAPADISGGLLRHLKAGRSIYIALDVPAPDRRPVAEIEMLGQRFPRNDWPAWLAVRSGRPLALWTTHGSGSRVVITASRVLHPDPALPVARRVAALSEELYAAAEAAIREHPEAWTFLAYPGLLQNTRLE